MILTVLSDASLKILLGDARKGFFLARARSTASPINAQRFDINTPCRIDGTCHNCNSPESICSYVHFLRNSRNKGRHVVVLVGEDLGY